ncbi:sulfite exporter TauE/SafE family protein [Parahaliea mediterranea]|uniref:Probable membrane transporter protein n=1 Tax=Parahaliea mediterranea TaxID=651086 RepID=A0A939DDL8_9GAMM|nr:sulfite exporter TauE/SafE family protein [Parahaliea mediterranea]MBN7796243.1 sulfite exporter TauE/SafE family protein [Parahaliea mediterranea]
MEGWMELLPLAVAMLATGVAAGVLAGLLGVGGGIVIVPVLEITLGVMGVDPAIRMHIAVATSLSTIILTSISSTRAHHRRGAVDFGLARAWGLYILGGAVAGTVLASQLDSSALSLIFAVVAIVVAVKMVLPVGDVRLSDGVPAGLAGKLPPVFIGGLSCMMGIGGGTLSVPAQTMMGIPMHRAVGTSALFGLLIALPGAVTYVVTGWGDPRLPVGNLGYVSLLGLCLIAPMTVLTAPLGAKLAHKLSQRHLTLAFGVFLLVVAVRMLYRALMAG